MDTLLALITSEKRLKRGNFNILSIMASLNLRPSTSAGELLSKCKSSPSLSKSEVVMHFPPKYSVHGYEHPKGKSTKVHEHHLCPQDWTRETNFTTRTHLRSERKARHLQDMQKSSSSILIRTLGELKGSHQVTELLSGTHYSNSIGGKGSRSQLIKDRRLADTIALKEQESRWEDPAVRIVRHIESGAHKPTVASHCFPVEVAFTDMRPETSFSVSSSVVDLKRDVIEGRPSHPTLEWIENPPTRGKTIQQRKENDHNEREDAIQRREQYPVVKMPQRRPRELGPLDHQETEDHGFGKDLKMQIKGVWSRKDLLSRRKEIMVEENEIAKDIAETKKLNQTQRLSSPILSTDEPWWALNESPERIAQVKEKQALIISDSREKITTHPAQSREYSRQVLELRDKRKQLAPNLSKFKRPEEPEVHRNVQRNRFTDVVIEFRQQTIEPRLDAFGKQLGYEEHENTPLYSSFTPDNVFMDNKDRLRAERACRADKRRHSNILRKQAFSISRRRPQSVMSQRQAIHYYHKPISTLFVGNCIENVNDVVRTGGFQNI